MKAIDKNMTTARDEILKVVEAKNTFIRDFSKLCFIKAMFFRQFCQSTRNNSSIGMMRVDQVLS